MFRKLIVIGCVLAAALTWTSPAAARTTCAVEGDGARWCNAPSTDYPRTTGWYGYVGRGGGPCGPNPHGTVHEPGMSGVCVMPAPEAVWSWGQGGWTRRALQVGTRVYVYPYTAEWRWIWHRNQWYAIPASRLTLEWRT